MSEEERQSWTKRRLSLQYRRDLRCEMKHNLRINSLTEVIVHVYCKAQREEACNYY